MFKNKIGHVVTKYNLKNKSQKIAINKKTKEYIRKINKLIKLQKDLDFSLQPRHYN